MIEISRVYCLGDSHHCREIIGEKQLAVSRESVVGEGEEESTRYYQRIILGVMEKIY